MDGRMAWHELCGGARAAYLPLMSIAALRTKPRLSVVLVGVLLLSLSARESAQGTCTSRPTAAMPVRSMSQRPAHRAT